jgi:pyrroloquinoline-quinone synthase
MIIRDPEYFRGWSTDDFISNLQAVRAKYPYGHHPIIDAMCEGAMAREHLKEFLIQWWWFGAVGSEQIFPLIMAGMPIDAGLYPIKKKIITNIYEEFYVPEIHPEINVDMITSGCGITRNEVYTAPVFSETSAFVAVVERYARQGWAEGVMSLMWSLESQSPIQFERQSKALREKYGFTDTRFPDIHIEADMEHAGDSDDFARLLVTPENMMAMYNAAADSVMGIWNWHESMYQRFFPNGHRALLSQAA